MPRWSGTPSDAADAVGIARWTAAGYPRGRGGGTTLQDAPNNRGLQNLIRRARLEAASGGQRMAGSRDELVAALLQSWVLVGTTAGGDIAGSSLAQAGKASLLTITTAAGARMLALFTDLAALRARCPECEPLAGPALQWMRRAAAELDGIVLDPAGSFWELAGDALQRVLQDAEGAALPAAPERRPAPAATARDARSFSVDAPRPELPLTLEAARRLAGGDGGGELVLAHTLEREWGWAFGFETGRGDGMLLGVGPVLVNRHDGSVHSCASSMPLQAWVERYERQLRWASRRRRVHALWSRLWPWAGRPRAEGDSTREG
jgi:hypothetical protein